MNIAMDRSQIGRAKASAVINLFGGQLSVLADGCAAPLVVGEQSAPPGYGVPMHRHRDDDEGFFILEGTLLVDGPDGERRVGPGDYVNLPRGLPHSFRNDSTTTTRFLVILAPGLQSLEMFRQFDRRAAAAEPLAPAEIGAIAAQYGVTFP